MCVKAAMKLSLYEGVSGGNGSGGRDTLYVFFVSLNEQRISFNFCNYFHQDIEVLY